MPDLVIHAFTDGRDTSPTSGADSLAAVEAACAAAGGGAASAPSWAATTRWTATSAGTAPTWRWRMLVAGEADHHADTGEAAVRAAYERDETDEFITPTTVGDEARIRPGDHVLAFNFRPDRMRQITTRLAEVVDSYTTMTSYDEDWDFPIVFPPHRPEVTIGAVIADAGRTQLHVAETEKYPHVTYFFNGGREEPYDGEVRELVPSPRDVPTYDYKPEMSAREATEAFLRHWEEGDHAFAIINFANADMVGHTGVIPAAVKAVETVDECLARVVEAVHGKGGACLVTADHGNADEMLEEDGSPDTAHSLNPVPFIVTAGAETLAGEGILADVAPTALGAAGHRAARRHDGPVARGRLIQRRARVRVTRRLTVFPPGSTSRSVTRARLPGRIALRPARVEPQLDRHRPAAPHAGAGAGEDLAPLAAHLQARLPARRVGGEVDLHLQVALARGRDAPAAHRGERRRLRRRRRGRRRGGRRDGARLRRRRRAGHLELGDVHEGLVARARGERPQEQQPPAGEVARERQRGQAARVEGSDRAARQRLEGLAGSVAGEQLVLGERGAGPVAAPGARVDADRAQGDSAAQVDHEVARLAVVGRAPDPRRCRRRAPASARSPGRRSPGRRTSSPTPRRRTRPSRGGTGRRRAATRLPERPARSPSGPRTRGAGSRCRRSRRPARRRSGSRRRRALVALRSVADRPGVMAAGRHGDAADRRAALVGDRAGDRVRAPPLPGGGGASNLAIGLTSSPSVVEADQPMPRAANACHSSVQSSLPCCVTAAWMIALRMSRKLGSSGASRSPPVT